MEQYLFEDDSEIGAINFIARDDPMLPTLPSPEVPEEILEEDTVPVRIVTPLHSPHPFLSDDLLQGDKSQLSDYQTSVNSENTNSELLGCIYPLPWTSNRGELPSRNKKHRSGPSACDIPVKRNKRNIVPSILKPQLHSNAGCRIFCSETIRTIHPHCETIVFAWRARTRCSTTTFTPKYCCLPIPSLSE